ncbi:MAG TPA: exopolyphosphatase [Thiobacillaceae bacterium]|nr:exopolyphosphatase [Thiobacillaceae bacterium]
MQEYTTLAAIDLGSNSFHLQVGRVEGEQLFYLDSLKEPVRLAGGLTADKRLDEASQQRALDCLARFGERLQGMPSGAVRAVGTSALRVAKNAPAFLDKARQALGFEIEIVAGREEARLIYLGVAHSLPLDEAPRLVVDIGGGSTECIIGKGYEPRERESLRMGCVVFTNRFFADGKLDKVAWKAAETAARVEAHAVAGQFHRSRWEHAVGSSGTAKALAEICLQNGQSDGAITLDGLKWLRDRLVKAGSLERLEVDGLKADRRPVIAGGAAVMYALFQELGIQEMAAAQGAMREGILWDLLGRVHDHDMRDLTVTQFMRRYHVEGRQARRVERLATRLYRSLDSAASPDALRYLTWAAKLHEVGISIAHSGYHKHGAYILENADMPGFSRRDQVRLASLVRTSRGGLGKVALSDDDALWPMILCLRLSVLFHQARSPVELPVMRLRCEDGHCVLRLSAAWLAANPLTQTALQEEVAMWQDVRPAVRLAAVRAV